MGGVVIGKINVRVQNGRVEFAFTPEDGERIKPSRHRFPTNANVGQWLESTDITFTLGRPTVAEMEAAILDVLFGGERAQANYNDWGCPDNEPQGGSCAGSYSRFNTSRNATGGYAGGHSGWDAQTISVAPPDMEAPDEPFYSLTNGEVIFVGDGTKKTSEDATRLIAVWTGDGGNGFVTRYLHAHSTCANLKVGDRVAIGQQLGIQGNAGVPGAVNKWDAEHVHVEMQNRRSHLYGYGAQSTNTARRTSDPVPTLYSQIANWRGDFKICRSSQDSGGAITNGNGGTPPPLAGDLIRVMGTQDVYEVRGSYRRLIIAGGIIDAVPEFRWDGISGVTQAVMNRYEESRLVRLPNDGGKVYLVVPTGADSAVLRHIPNEAAFNRAGCKWDAVYDITAQEASFSGYSKGAAMPSSGWSC